MAILTAAFMMKSLSFASLLATGKIPNTFVQLAAQEGIGCGFDLILDKYKNQEPKIRTVLKRKGCDETVIAAVEWLVNHFDAEKAQMENCFNKSEHVAALEYVKTHAGQLAATEEAIDNITDALVTYLNAVYAWRVSHPDMLMKILQEMWKAIRELQEQEHSEDLHALLQEMQQEIAELKQQETLSKEIHYLTALPVKSKLLHRDTELDTLAEMVDRGENPVLVNGMGGIGKTALAAELFRRLADSYDRIGWIRYEGSLKESLLAQVNLAELNSMQDPEARFQKIMELLRNDSCSTLLFVDNVDRDIYEDDDLQELAGWEHLRMVLTSRRDQLDGFTAYPVGFLTEDACVDLFYHYYGRTDHREEAVVREIVSRACCHTLTVELLAKAAARQRSLQAYYETLVQAGFEAPTLKVRTRHDEEFDVVKRHMQILFDISGLKDEPELICILWNFALMPSMEIPAEVTDWIGADENDLVELQMRGWLAWNDDTSGYFMHPLISEIIRMEHDTMPENAAAHFLGYLEDNDNNYFNKAEVYTIAEQKISIAEGFVANVPQIEQLQKANIWGKIGIALYHRGQYGKALAYDQESLKIKEEIFALDSTDIAETYNNIAVVYNATGDYVQSLEYYRKALVICEKVLGMDHPSTATTYNNIACVLSEKGDYEQALENTLKALAIREKALGKDHPDTATTYDSMAVVFRAQGDYEQALENTLKALAIREKVLGRDHPRIATTYHNIAGVLGDLGKYGQALEYYRKALLICEKVLGKQHPNTAAIYNNMAFIYRAQGDYVQAMKYYQQALEIREKVLGKEHTDTAVTYMNMAVLLYYMKYYEKAEVYAQKACNIFLVKLGPEHPYIKPAQRWLADILRAVDEQTVSAVKPGNAGANSQ